MLSAGHHDPTTVKISSMYMESPPPPPPPTTTSQFSTTSPSGKLTTSTPDVTIASSYQCWFGSWDSVCSHCIDCCDSHFHGSHGYIKLRRVHTATNQAYDVTDEDPYSYPEVVLESANAMETNLNEAYCTNIDNISADPNVAYVSTNMAFQENEALL